MYVKCPSIPAAMAAVSALHGRWFGGECYVSQCWIKHALRNFSSLHWFYSYVKCYSVYNSAVHILHDAAFISWCFSQVKWSKQHMSLCQHTTIFSLSRCKLHSFLCLLAGDPWSSYFSGFWFLIFFGKILIFNFSKLWQLCVPVCPYITWASKKFVVFFCLFFLYFVCFVF